jgi:branched-chain amino acid transport system ATP-binding protein
MSEIILRTDDLTKAFGGLTAVDQVSLNVHAGEILGIIGPNGAGKTTFFNLLTGLTRPDSGAIYFKDRNITQTGPETRAWLGLARTFQNGRVFGNLSVLDNVKIGAHMNRNSEGKTVSFLGIAGEFIHALCNLPAYHRNERRQNEQAIEILKLFGERLLPRIHDPAYSLSYANRRRVEIARALALKPVILFLDEPTAGMNPAETEEMLHILFELKKTGLTMVIIEHKLPLIIPVSDRIAVMDEGKKIADGDPLKVSWEPAVIQAYLGRKQFIKIKEMENLHVDDESTYAERY